MGGWSTQSPRCFTFRKSLDIYFSRLGGPQGQSGWVLKKRKLLSPGRDQTLYCLARSKPLYHLHYPGSFKAVSTSDYTTGVVSYTSSGSHTSEGNFDNSHELIKKKGAIIYPHLMASYICPTTMLISVTSLISLENLLKRHSCSASCEGKLLEKAPSPGHTSDVCTPAI
jgi:hypothetical protein